MSPTICSLFVDAARRSTEYPAVKFKSHDHWHQLTWQQYFERAQEISFSLHELNLKPSDKIAIMSNTRVEWSLTDYAAMGSGAIVVPIYHSITIEDCEYILNNSESRFLFVESKALVKSILTIIDKCPQLEKIICFERIESEDERVIPWDTFLNYGRVLFEKEPKKFEQSCRAVTASDVATILYTSGTTGLPKGVVLCHSNIISEVVDAFSLFGVGPADSSLSFLPYAHIMGRVEHWGHVYIGFTLAFAESVERVKQNLQEIQPTFLIAVPRIFEKIYSAIWSQMETQKIKLKVFRTAMAISMKIADCKIKRETPPIELLAGYLIAKKLVLDKIKEAFGGRLRFAISGGAPLSRDIALFFYAADILLLEGYGLTETTAAICVNRTFDFQFGTVGKPVGDTQIKIAEDGEILAKGQKIMASYFKDPEATQASLKDGWFSTGDIGEFTSSGNLKITDRKKDLIKTGGGKYVAPQKLESLLKLHPIISNVLIHGDEKKYIVALITLDRQFILAVAKDKQIPYADITSLIQNQVIQDLVKTAITDANSHLASFETIKKYLILPSEFTVESGELTPSLKVKRKFLDQKYRSEIESLY
jgi:long-chain acyl-CoA synthetase